MVLDPGNSEFWTNPIGLGIVAVLIGFGAVAAAKLYGFLFMRWKTPFRVGEAMHVRRAQVTEWSNGEGYVNAGGELWRAISTDTIAAGDQVTIASVNGLMLTVKKTNK